MFKPFETILLQLNQYQSQLLFRWNWYYFPKLFTVIIDYLYKTVIQAGINSSLFLVLQRYSSILKHKTAVEEQTGLVYCCSVELVYPTLSLPLLLFLCNSNNVHNWKTLPPNILGSIFFNYCISYNLYHEWFSFQRLNLFYIW